jgi:hypothetical protein
MRRVLVVALALSLSAPVSVVFAAGTGDAAATASITGSARGPVAHAAANSTVHLRNVANGQVTATTTANAWGQFSFVGLQAGHYVVEVVNAAGAVIGTSTPVTLAAGAVVTGIGVSAAGAAAASAAGIGAFLGSTVGIASVAAAGVAVAGVTVAATRPDASPSR